MRIAASATVAGLALALAACGSGTTGGQATGSTAASGSGGGATSTAPPTTSAVQALGTTVTMPRSRSGVGTALVGAVYPNATSSVAWQKPANGTTWFAADVTLCAGTKGSRAGLGPRGFSLVLDDGSTAKVANSSGPLTGPLATLNPLLATTSLAPRQCERGWVMWSVPTGKTASYVQFSTGTSSKKTAGTARWPAT